ncbi:MAG: outer membrane protein [Nitrobacter sp.]
MKKILLATVGLVALGATVPALAADLAARHYTKAPAYEATPIYNWTGFYIGGHVGGAFGLNNDNGDDGHFLGGGQIGYDYQFSPNWVLGIEANYSFVDTGRTDFFSGGSPFANRGLGSVTGRLGYTWGPAMLYAKGGYAWADTRVSNGIDFDNGGRDGYTVGGGLEYLFTQNWSGKIEYQYYDFGRRNFDFQGIPQPGVRNEEQTIKAGLNYRFNWGGPVVARY